LSVCFSTSVYPPGKLAKLQPVRAIRLEAIKRDFVQFLIDIEVSNTA
jgi:hypothetical protein